jgi:hypothetical protein
MEILQLHQLQCSREKQGGGLEVDPGVQDMYRPSYAGENLMAKLCSFFYPFKPTRQGSLLIFRELEYTPMGVEFSPPIAPRTL